MGCYIAQVQTSEQRKHFVMTIMVLKLSHFLTIFLSRYKHRSYDGAKTWIEPAAGTNIHRFNEVHIRGSAQLAVMPLNGLQAPVQFHADRLYGDKSGFLHVGYHQNVSVAVTDPDIPFGLRVYENGSMMLPRRAFLQTVSFKSSGKVGIPSTVSSSIQSLSFNKTGYSKHPHIRRNGLRTPG